jgi:UDP-glucose:(heptosyl)LPS alpha-1,3-glucosyltransferase
MQLAFCLYKYFPFGGLQRDFLQIALACQRRGHAIRVYTLSWQGDAPAGFELVTVPVKALTNARRYEKFTAWVAEDLARRPADRCIGFNKMPGLDVYYAADPCYEEKARTLRNPLYRLSGRYRHFAAYERAVFAPPSRTEILMISSLQQPFFEKHYQTPVDRFHLLPPGIARDRRAPPDAAEIRAAFRQEFGLKADDLLLLQVGSGFKTKGWIAACWRWRTCRKRCARGLG